MPLVLGGVLAACIGAGAMVAVPGLLGQPGGATDALQQDLAAKSAQITALQAELDALRGEIVPAEALASVAGDLAARVDEAKATLQAEITAAQAEAEARLTALEKRPVEGGAASATALEAFERDMQDMRALLEANRAASQTAAGTIEAAAAEAEARIAAAEAEAVKLKAEAEMSGRRVAAQAALSHLQAAFVSGMTPDPALADLAAAGVAVPAGLPAQIEAAPTLQQLRADFPQAARLALAVSLRATTTEDTGAMDRFGAFLRSQTGARSLEPRTGDDPDAVLSRAEAALKAGDVPGTLAAFAALPDEGRAALAPWIASAQARLDAEQAISALSAGLE